MKKQLVMAVLGISAMGLASSYGQGQIQFSTYNSSSSLTIKYAASNVPAGKNNLAVGGAFAANLFYASGTGNTLAQVLAGTQIGGPIFFGFDGGTSAGTAADSGNPLTAGAGWIVNGPVISITGNTGQAGSFALYVFNNGSPGAATVGGYSSVFTLTPGFGGSPVPNLPDQGFTVQNLAPVPEPASFALLGLGGLASLVIMRRKQA